MKVSFKIAMDNEQKKLNNVKTVTLDVSFDGVSNEVIRTAAIKQQTVAWQSQIRSHWTEFVEKGVPETITFGVPLFSTARQAPVTTAAINAHVEAMAPADKLKLAISAMKAAGMDTAPLEEELAILIEVEGE